MNTPTCSSSAHRSVPAWRGVLAALVLAAALGGCADTPTQTDDAQSLRDEARVVLAPQPAATHRPASPSPATQAAARGRWSIAIANFPRTPEGQTSAQYALRRVTTVGKLAGARIEPRNKRLVLSFGSYESPADPNAARDLARVRSITITGPEGGRGRPYAGAILSPPPIEATPGSIPEFDLANARATHPGAEYSLQIGIYGNLDRPTQPSPAELAEIRKAAEQAVNILRRDGEEAFYYHGPTRSTITVGAFTRADYDPYPPDQGPAVESPRVRQARQRHPHNLLNGSGIRRKIPGTPGTKPEHFRLEPSFMIAIPK